MAGNLAPLDDRAPPVAEASCDEGIDPALDGAPIEFDIDYDIDVIDFDDEQDGSMPWHSDPEAWKKGGDQG